MNLRPLPYETATDDLCCLADIDRSISELDRAFTHLSDRSFGCLSSSYKQLADAVVRVVADRSRWLA